MILKTMRNALRKVAEFASLFKRLREKMRSALGRTAQRLCQPVRAVCAVLPKAEQGVPHFA
jgi:hypothetical protein